MLDFLSAFVVASFEGGRIFRGLDSDLQDGKEGLRWHVSRIAM